jgi:O-glycosyl hydrolase
MSMTSHRCARQLLLAAAATAAVIAPSWGATVTAAAAAAAAPTTVVDFGARQQPIDGFGTSLCWWAVGVGGWSNDTAFNELMDLFFANPEASGGLGLNQVRYNIGGSDVQAGDAHFLRAGGFVQTFEPTKGHYDWSADPTQRRVLAAAQERGVRYVQGFANSPPYWMTVSGSVTGNKDGTKDNLKADSFSDFATHLATVTQHFHTQWNITFDSITPLNEPVTGWWKYGNQQEGCHFDRSSQSRIVGLLGRELASRSLTTVVSGPEENWVDDSLKSVAAYQDADLSSLGLITTHTYNGRPGQREALSSFASKHGKRLWASEYGDGDTSGVSLAKRITYDLNHLNCSVWTLWQTADLDNSLTTTSGWGLTATSYCGCTMGRSCVCGPDAGRCQSLHDTWKPSWSNDPSAACAQWSTNSKWGALAHGATLNASCAASFGRQDCAKTCCEAGVGPSSSDTLTRSSSPVGAFAIRKSFYAYRQFTAHIRPGSTIIRLPEALRSNPAGDLDSAENDTSVLAAVTPEGNAVLVFTNPGERAQPLRQPLRGISNMAMGTTGDDSGGVAGLCATAHLTDDAHNGEVMPSHATSLQTTQGTTDLHLVATLPSRSITTFVIRQCE